MTPRLQQDFDHITILIYGTPEIVFLTVNSHEEFVDMPSIAETPLSLLETSGVVGPELPAPSSDGFIRNDDATFGEKIFHVTEAHAEAMDRPRQCS